MKLSIVTTLYQSASYIDEFYARCTKIAREVAGDDYQIVFVNDGSPDESLEHCQALLSKDSKILLVDLSRNFGHHKAIMAGLEHASGDLVFLIDSDLEEQPEWLLEYLDEFKQNRVDVVFGVQKSRRGDALGKIFGLIFYRLFRFVTGVNQPDNIVTARLMSKRYVQALLLHKEREINIGGLWLITGFDQLPIYVKKLSTSSTTYSFRRKLSHLVNAVTSFSSMPLVFTFYSGVGIVLTSLVFLAYLLTKYFFFNAPPDGYTSLIVSIWFFSGLIILFLGVQGIYLSKVFSEVKQRPNAIIRAIYQHKE